ncbi:alcohol acetyltransferase [Mycena metata]|uniref:Alcohol acetyltransferase n=1 Tax=Mycena metata TaxID=1033252 RepID=A0AAD7JBD3_9AGAR|nr:alcohol acetyltransferase [Mycena metata]
MVVPARINASSRGVAPTCEHPNAYTKTTQTWLGHLHRHFRAIHQPGNIILTKEVLFPALKTLIETHAVLGICFDNEADSVDVAFARLSTIELPHIVEFSETCDLQEATERQMCRRFDDTRHDLPLWRVQILPDNTVILALHHAIADGISTAAFHCALLRALQSASSSSFPSSVVVPDLPLLPAMDDLTDTSVSLWTVFSTLFEALAPRWFTNAYYAWSGHPVPTVIKIQPHVRLVQFDAPDAKRLADACRAQGATVTSALYILTVCVLSRLLAATNTSYKTISVLTPISLRGVATPTPTPSSALCNQASSCTTYPPLKAEFSWSDAARFAVELKAQKLKAREQYGIVRLIANRYTRFILGDLGTTRRYGLIFSNLGRIEVDAEAEKAKGKGNAAAQWSMGNMFFVHEDTFAGPALGLNIVGDPAGGINICVKWGEESLDAGFVDAFVPMFEKAFHSLLV